MQFHEFGDKGNKTLLVMHGMLCDWRKFREIFMPLEQDFRVIYPAMNGCYDGAPDFKSFADECAEIEKYIVDNYNGQVNAVIGVSQGATLMAILASRNVVTIKKAILDGVYVAHQGKLCADLALKAFLRMQKNGGVPSKAFLKALPLMGLDESDLDEFKLMYWGGTRESMKANLIENYTYRVPADFRIERTKVFLWCGSKEPYAKKSHEILKKHITDYEERIFEGCGHGQMMVRETAEYLELIRRTLREAV
jgi:pimeloyl-ACP methyl ester carboxylesterase